MKGTKRKAKDEVPHMPCATKIKKQDAGFSHTLKDKVILILEDNMVGEDLSLAWNNPPPQYFYV